MHQAWRTAPGSSVDKYFRNNWQSLFIEVFKQAECLTCQCKVSLENTLQPFFAGRGGATIQYQIL